MNTVQMDFFGNHVTHRVERRRATGKDLKERGMRLVIDNEGDHWRHAALNKIREWRVAQHLGRTHRANYRLHAFEDIKQWCLERGLEEPQHVNAWGAIAQAATREGIIRPTGDFALAKLRLAHGRAVRLYEVV